MCTIKRASLCMIVFAFCIGSTPLFGLETSPSWYRVLPEVIWAAATGGGEWMSDVQITDMTGGSIVSAFFYYGGGNYRGGTTGITLWTGSGVGQSVKFVNILSVLQGLDSGFTYYGKVGTLVLRTQGSSYKIHATARTYNGNYSKTFPALSSEYANSASLSRPMVIQNLTNNATYRSTVGIFNLWYSETVDFYLIDSNGTTIGNAFAKTFATSDFQAFFPFNEAGVPYPGYSYDNVWLKVVPRSNSAQIMCFGATANNTTNDPAAHFAVQAGGSYYNSATYGLILPETIWAPASYGGTWVTDVQITDMTGGSQVMAMFYFGGGSYRGPFLLWTSTGQYHSIKISNILSMMDAMDTDNTFSYFGRVGAVEFITGDFVHNILVSARTYNGNYSKTFPGLNRSSANTNFISLTRPMMIQDLTNNSTYRSTIGLINKGNACVLEFHLYDGSGDQVGSTFTKSLPAYEFIAFSPFTEAGVPFPGYSYDNVYLIIQAISGTNPVEVACFGASANNTTNDPAAHIAVQKLAD